jgi:hypothetical protein
MGTKHYGVVRFHQADAEFFCTQKKITALMGAAACGYVDLVKQMAEMGGKEYLMQADFVSIIRLRLIHR